MTSQGFKWGPFGSVQPQGQRFWNEDVEFGLKVSMHFTVSLRKRMEIRWPGLDPGFPTYYVVWDKRIHPCRSQCPYLITKQVEVPGDSQ